MLDLVPLAGARREVQDGDRESGSVGETLELPLPEPDSWSVAAAGVGRDEELVDVRITGVSHVAPPTADGVDGEAGGVMRDAHADPALVACEIVNPVGDRFAQFRNQEVVYSDPFGASLRPPFAAWVLEVPDQLLLLRVHRDRG